MTQSTLPADSRPETRPGSSVGRRIEALVHPAQLVSLARSMLDAAEATRRGQMNKFDAAPLKGQPVAGDWSAAGLLIERAMAHLDEALPGGQIERASHALGALVIGVDLLVAAMALRGVKPTELYFGPERVGPDGEAAP